MKYYTFSTGDILAAVFARYLGIPTIYQVASSSSLTLYRNLTYLDIDADTLHKASISTLCQDICTQLTISPEIETLLVQYEMVDLRKIKTTIINAIKSLHKITYQRIF